MLIKNISKNLKTLKKWDHDLGDTIPHYKTKKNDVIPRGPFNDDFKLIHG